MKILLTGFFYGEYVEITAIASVAEKTTRLSEWTNKISTGGTLCFFSGVCLLTKDVRRLSDFYQKVLQTSSDCDDEIHQEIHTGGAHLAILKYADADGGNPNMNMAFTVDDVDREYLRLRDLGVEIPDEPTTRPWGARNMRFCDPDGNYIVFRSFPE